MHTRWFLLIFALFLLPFTDVNARADVGGWGNPGVIANNWWIAARTNADATRVVLFDPYTTSGTGQYADWYYDRQVMVSEYSNGAWTTPVVVGSNAMYRPIGWLPIVTHPVISADGSTIAYLGCAGVCKPIQQGDSYEVYVSTRGPAGWSQPARITTSTDSLHEHISLSADGNTLAYGNNQIMAGFSQVFVVRRTGGVWGTPVAISSGTLNGWKPELSQDGQQVIWISNPSQGGGSNILMYSKPLPGGGWSAPQVLETGVTNTSQIDQQRFTPDGNSLFYWMTLLTQKDGNTVCSGQDLYTLRRTGTTWSAPQKVTATPIVPMACDGEAPAAVDNAGTRVVYPRTVLQGDTITSTFFEIMEYKNASWGAPVAITTSAFPYYAYPNLSASGKRLVSIGPNATYGPALIWMEESLQTRTHTYIPLVNK